MVRFQRQGFAKIGDRFIWLIEAIAEQPSASQELVRPRARRLGLRDLRVQKVEKDFSVGSVSGLMLQGFGDLDCFVEGSALIGIDLQNALNVREGIMSTLVYFAEQLREFDANGDLVAAREVRKLDLEEPNQRLVFSQASVDLAKGCLRVEVIRAIREGVSIGDCGVLISLDCAQRRSEPHVPARSLREIAARAAGAAAELDQIFVSRGPLVEISEGFRDDWLRTDLGESGSQCIDRPLEVVELAQPQPRDLEPQGGAQRRTFGTALGAPLEGLQAVYEKSNHAVKIALVFVVIDQEVGRPRVGRVQLENAFVVFLCAIALVQRFDA
jgi:hypothetical protein